METFKGADRSALMFWVYCMNLYQPLPQGADKSTFTLRGNPSFKGGLPSGDGEEPLKFYNYVQRKHKTYDVTAVFKIRINSDCKSGL